MVRLALTIAVAGLGLASPSLAQVIQPPFDASYTFVDLGSPPGVPQSLGGLTIRASEPNVLYIGGSANSMAAKVYAVSLSRDAAGHIIGFGCGDAVTLCNAPGVNGGIDGGLEFGPGGVLFYTTYADNRLGQVKPGEVDPASLIDLSAAGVASSTGALRFVPAGFPGAGRLKLLSYNTGFWYDTTVTSLPNGTYQLGPISPHINIGGGPEGIVYVAAGSPEFGSNAVIVSEYATGRIVTYDINANGDPLPRSRRVLMTGLSGAEGAAIDPITGDFLFSTFGGASRVLAVRGFDAASCVGDLNGSGDVDAADLAILLGEWGQTTGGSASDLNTDCKVDAADLGLMLGNWGSCS